MSEISDWEDETVHMLAQPWEDTVRIPKEYEPSFRHAITEANPRFLNGTTDTYPDDDKKQVLLDMKAAGVSLLGRLAFRFGFTRIR